MLSPLRSNYLFSSPYTGPTFDIIAGSEHMHFTAHATVLEQSDHLKAVIHGKWKDSLELKIVLEDWDAASVGRMLQWLYTGDYMAPNPKGPVHLVKDHHQIAKSPSVESSKPNLTPFANLHFSMLPLPAKRTEAEKCEAWMEKMFDLDYDLDYEPTLMAHAKLYVLANYMLLPGLQAFTFERLYKLLSTMSRDIGKTVISNLVSLIEYIHATTTRPDGGEEPLQDLVTTFIAYNFSQFDGVDGERLMNQNRDFAKDVLVKVRSIMVDMQDDLKSSLRWKILRLEREILDLT